jgi:hypothetical protein
MSQFIGEKSPLVTKAIEDQKKQITTQVENNLINRQDVVNSAGNTEINEPYYIPVYNDRERAYYDYKINPKYPEYNYEQMKKTTDEIISRIKNDEQFAIMENTQSHIEKLFEFLENLHEGEYLAFAYISCFTYPKSVSSITLITNFGSIYNTFSICHQIFGVFRNDNIIPKSILETFIDNATYRERIDHDDVVIFKRSITGFQKWQQSISVSDSLKKEALNITVLRDQCYRAIELLDQTKKDNEIIRKELEETKKDLEEIKYMCQNSESFPYKEKEDS